MSVSTSPNDRDSSPSDDQLIAVVGMAAHLPGARDVATFWENLRAGVESIRRFTDAELEAAGVDSGLLRDPHYVKANGVLDEMEWFDAGFFGLSPIDAAVMDPQTRHFLECVWHALEDSGHVPERFEGNIGVFAGAGAGQYFWKNVVQNRELMETVGYFLLRHTGNDKDFLATRASYEFNLTGPSVGVQTACSTSLVAIHYACQSLLSWECDMAIAGGVTIEQPHHVGYLYEDGEILSPDGHCRSFDHRSQGTVFGSGAGVVVLRRLADAVADGDAIHAVIRGSAVNNDGASKVSYLAPSVDGQAKAITEALTIAGVEADTIGMVEGHGTATPVGDPIEVSALTQAYRTHTDERGFCALGSVKSNIGHLDTAAGVASFIKAVLALKHGEIPPTLHFEAPNPLLELDTSPFYVNATRVPWPTDLSPRRAGVSSLGVGGTNAHVILEEAPAPEPSGPSRPWTLLTLSGRSAGVMEDASRNLVEFLEANPDAPLADVSFTLRHGRRRFEHRRALLCSSVEEAVETLSLAQGPWLTSASERRDRRPVAFLFAGGGAQYPQMGRELYEREPVFREAVDRCLSYVKTKEGIDLRPTLFPERGKENEAAIVLQRPSLTLPALFTIQYAQAQLWMSWGVRPASMIGHSMGEYTAACLAGVFSLEAALSLVALRGRLFERVEAGAMLSVNVDESALKDYLGSDLSVAAVNAPGMVVASGPVAAIDVLEERLRAAEIDCRRIRIDVAAHSGMLEPILPDFEQYVRTLRLSKPEIPMISNLTGDFAGAEITDPMYWVRHLRETVRFSDGLGRLLDPEGPVILEIGPGRTLSTLARMHPDWSSGQPALSSLPHPEEPADAQAFQLATLGALWVHGVDPDWTAFDGEEVRQRLPLPGYPFERAYYFVDPPTPQAEAQVVGSAARSDDPAEWLQQASWAPTSLPEAAPAAGTEAPILVLADEGTAGDRLADALVASGRAVLRVRSGSGFAPLSEGSARVRPSAPEDWSALVGHLRGQEAFPAIIVHAWSLGAGASGSNIDRPFFGPLHLFQALEATVPGQSLRFVAVASNTLAVSGDDPLDPARATLLGPIRVAPREIPSLRCRLVDVGSLPSDPPREARVLARILPEILVPSDDTIVAFRGQERLAERFAKVPLDAGRPGAGLREQGVYLVTGGLGGIGLVVAREMAEHARARIALVGRTALPPRAEWAAWIASHPEGDKTSRAIREIEYLEGLGAKVSTFAGDVTDTARMREIVQEVRREFGALHGVVHAAGILDDGPLLGRDRKQASRVLDPKVAGTVALDTALDGVDLDFFFLFSSVSAVIGAPGQIDYAAANSFLDAFARERAGRAAGRSVSVAWGAWKDVGMAAELAGEARYDLGPGTDEEQIEELAHPIFDASVTRSGGERAFRIRFTKDRHWMMEEHRLRGGSWVLPGSGYVELIRAAVREASPETPFTLAELVFLKPFMVRDGEMRELEIRLAPSGHLWNVSVSGRRLGGSWVEHATASVGTRAFENESYEAFDAVLDRVGRPAPEDRPPHPVMDFGPRWANIAAAATSGSESLLKHVLPERYRGDLETVALHPAILDMATAGAQHLIPGVDTSKDFFVPAGYGNLQMHGPLGGEVTSHIRLRSADESGALASFDVTVYDSDGRVVVDVRDFSMLRILGDALGAEEDGPQWLRDAISPREGRDVLRRILAHPTASHLLIATRPLGDLIAEAGRAQLRSTARGGPAKKAPTRVPFPEVAATLESHEAVREAAALGTRAEGEPARVVAFVAYEPGRHATVSELRRFVRGQIEKELVPQNFVEMVGLPRLADGSIAHEELRDPFAAVDDYVAPRTESEQAIASIWAELLGLDRVGIHDNFLDVGGHSLVGIRVLLRIQQATGVRLEANALTMQTLEQLAADVDRASGRAPQVLAGASEEAASA